MRGDESSLGNHPAALNDIEKLWIGIEHVNKFSQADYDDLAIVFPFEATSTIGFGIARFSAGKQELFYESNLYGTEPDEVIDVGDYLFVSAFAHRWSRLNVGGSLFLLYKKLDQHGLGIRGDLSAQYTIADRILLGALLKGAIPSTARWESEYFEYEPPDLFLGAGLDIPSNYFYGSFGLAFQTKGLFQEQAKSQSSLVGERVYQGPLDILKTLNFGFEYKLNLGLVFRFGVPEIGTSLLDNLPALGTGYRYRNFIKLNYSFIPHPELLSTHRISLSISPAFKGKMFKRPQGQAGKQQMRKHKTTGAPVKLRPADGREEQEQKTTPAVPEPEVLSGEKEKQVEETEPAGEEAEELEELEEPEELEIMEEEEEY
ncbi:hypothetical protein ACFL5V_11200 [Fibrobacterota bacterium]